MALFCSCDLPYIDSVVAVADIRMMVDLGMGSGLSFEDTSLVEIVVEELNGLVRGRKDTWVEVGVAGSLYTLVVDNIEEDSSDCMLLAEINLGQFNTHDFLLAWSYQSLLVESGKSLEVGRLEETRNIEVYMDLLKMQVFAEEHLEQMG